MAKRPTQKKPTPAARKKVRRLTVRRPAAAAYRREAPAGFDQGIRADIEARVEAASRIRDEITAKIDRGLMEAQSPGDKARGWR